MPVNTTGQGNISISSINTENTSTTSNSLKTLSETAVEGLNTLNEAPYAMSEFSGYQHFNWGTPVLPSGTNVTKIFHMGQESRSGNDTCVVCSFKMTHNTSTKTITYSVQGTDDGGGFSPDFTVGTGGYISYSGTLSSLEARFVYSGEAILCTGSGNSANGKVLELFSNSGHISNAHINNNTTTGSVITTSNDISGGANGTFRPLRTTQGSMSVALAATSDGGNTDNDSSRGSISFSGSDSLTIQLKANNSTTVNLYSRTGSFTMESLTTEEDTS